MLSHSLGLFSTVALEGHTLALRWCWAAVLTLILNCQQVKEQLQGTYK